MPRPRRAAAAPATATDPVATRTSWGPAEKGGANFGIHRLVRVDADHLEFRLRPLARLFPLAFVLAGLGAGALFVTVGLQRDPVMALAGGSIGSVFTGVGLWLLRRMSTPRVFDRRRNRYWRSRLDPRALDPRDRHLSCDLDEVHAVQLLAEWCSGNQGGSYRSYEINLVLADGHRLNVTDHGDAAGSRRDAAALAEFLGVPLWDATVRP